jgi:protoporphyrinogen oxidase
MLTGMGAGRARSRERQCIVVGGGIVGLAVARQLRRAGRQVVLLEAGPSVGGLASAVTIETSLGPVTWDRFYHVVLTDDRRVRALLSELDVPVHDRVVRSQMLAGGRVLEMSSVLDLLRLQALTPIDRLRVGLTVGVGGVLPITARTDRLTAARWLRRWGGRRAYRDLWAPLLRAKLGTLDERASAVFIRSTFRRLLTARLRGGSGDRFGYIEGSYAGVLERLQQALVTEGARIRTGTPVSALIRDGDAWAVEITGGEMLRADEVVLTTPGPLAGRLAGGPSGDALPLAWEGLRTIAYLGCVCVVVVTRKPVTGAYLTYVTDDTPYTAIVEMTNLVDHEQTGGLSVLYLPRYTTPDDPLFDAEPDQVAKEFVDDLVARYPGLRAEDVIRAQTSSARHVMPVPEPGRRSSPVPAASGRPGLYLASSVQITDGTLNVETSLRIADAAVVAILHAGNSSEACAADPGREVGAR